MASVENYIKNCRKCGENYNTHIETYDKFLNSAYFRHHNIDCFNLNSRVNFNLQNEKRNNIPDF